LLASEAARFLEPTGKIVVEFGDGQENAIAGIFEKAGWEVETIINDYTARPRMLSARVARSGEN
jgi:methylase of polypeptide subunit release factors